MAATLSDFITQRMTELTVSLAPLRERMSEIEDELSQLQRAADAAGIKVPASANTFTRNSTPNEHIRRSVPERTIKQAVLSVLRGKLSGLTALDILDQVNALLGVDYPRTSLSPQLSRLKADGFLVREGNVWKSTVHGHLESESPQIEMMEDALK